MFISLLAIATFRVVPIVLPASYGTMFFGTSEVEGWAVIGANGSVAVALKNGDYATRIGIVRPNGTTTYLPLPSPALVAKQIEVEQPANFADVRLAADGTPFATVSSCHEAVGGGSCASAYFVWSGAWHALPHPGGAKALTAAYALGAYAFDFDDGSNTDGFGNSYSASKLIAYRGGRPADLGDLTATSMNGRYLTAIASRAPMPPMCDPTPAPHPTATPVPQAMLFDGSAMRQLGPGHAFAANASGDTVGDDAPDETSGGRPTLWTNGTAVTLSEKKGWAAAIDDAGLIAGTAGDGVFVADAHDPQHRAVAIDELLADRTWHVVEERGIAGDGRILAVAIHGKGPKRLVLLEPVKT